MGSYSFKSAGLTQQQRTIEAINNTPTPVGIKTPLQEGVSEGILAMHMSVADQMHDNLRNLILTNWGERVGLYDFGANLYPLVTEFATQEDFDAQAIQRINSAVSRWMPYVSLEDFLSEVDRVENKNTGVIKLTITYRIPALLTDKRALQVVLYVI